MNFSGYTYDKKLHCYFRAPPKHFEQLSQFNVIHDSGRDEKDVVKSRKSSHCGLYKHLQQREITVGSSAHSVRLLNEYVVPTMKRRDELKLSMPTTISQFEDIMIDGSGELLAVRYSSPPLEHCQIYQINSQLSNNFDMIWNTTSTSPTQGHHSMNFAVDMMNITHFLYPDRSLHSNKISITKYVHNDLKLRETKALYKPATSVTINPNSCDWDNLYYAVGFLNGSVQVCNNAHRMSFKSSSMNSTILSLTYSLQNSLLFAGYRNGKCCVWDTRLDSKSAVTFQELPAGTRLSSSIIAIHPLLDPNYVISNALNSNLSMWDMRMSRKIMRFEGHINEYKTCNSIVDKLGSFLAAVGSDGNVRIWSTRSGNLIHTLDRSPNDCEIPNITYSESLGGISGKPTLLVTKNSAIFIYQT